MVSLLLGVQVARVTVAARLADTDPATAARFAPEIPPVRAALAMAEVGAAASTGLTLPRQTTERLNRLSFTAPLRPEPYLVNAALAAREDDFARAEALLAHARWRNPRSPGARYLLADTLLREGKVIEGLREMAVVSRLIPSTSVQLIPALADFAQTPGAREQLDAVLRANPRLKLPLLNALASDPANAGLVVALAGADSASADPRTKQWKSRLVEAFVERGDYASAYALWRQFAGLPASASPLVYNASFNETPAPSPFNWTYSSAGGAGLAEPANGRLRVIYYGRKNLGLASQLLLLEPGSYRFAAPVSGTAAAGAIAWTLTCVPSRAQLMQLVVGQGDSARFTVPAGCPAQRLVLKGRRSEMPQNSDVQIGPVVLQRAGS